MPASKCVTTLLKAGWERALPFAFIMQSLAANLGGMILPFGNPQNLYLFERFSIPLGDFLATMALPFHRLSTPQDPSSLQVHVVDCLLNRNPRQAAVNAAFEKETRNMKF